MPAGSTYTPIATTTLGSTSTSVTFNSFSGYTDLVLIASVTPSGSGLSPQMRVNSDTGSNYSYTVITGNGTSASSSRGTSNTSLYWYEANSPATGSPTPYIINFMNYSNTTTFKTILGRFGGAGIEAAAKVNLWRSTSAITSFEFFTSASSFAVGSTFTLYGIASA
jgi:hypothetical protein